MRHPFLRSRSLVPLFALLGAGCGESASDTMGPGPIVVPPVGAPGVAITRVVMYQAVERTLIEKGAVANSSVPLVAGRDALVRVFFTAEAGYDGADVLARLTVDDGEPIEVTQKLTGGSSRPEVLTSTINFRIDGARIGNELKFSIGLLQKQREGAPTSAQAVFPAEGKTFIPVLAKANVLRIVLAPFAYQADGSNRLPDLSAAQVEKFRQRFLQLYPVSDVKVRVRAPHPWKSAIRADGTGWEQVGYTLSSFRATDGETEDAYYYAIFNPASSMQSYCSKGCLLGVTLLNDRPALEGNPQLRLALGVGYGEVAADTAAHEIGHSHGREHAPCGSGIDPRSLDGDYPYSGGKIGTWGWDIVSGALVAPTKYSDIMGYCNSQWISDYNFTALSLRGQAVNTGRDARRDLPVMMHEVITVGGDGETRWNPALPLSHPLQGEVTPVIVTDEDGSTRQVDGHFYRYDHLPGGWLFVPASSSSSSPDASSARSFEFQLGSAVHVT
ncbi:MAG: hypothetical protein EXR72_14950, partial [Myxococcales bacterium]|nr:hypothetical protein [Myxococcales bacterium]